MTEAWTIGKIWIYGVDTPIDIEVRTANGVDYTVKPLSELLPPNGEYDRRAAVVAVVFDLDFNKKTDGPQNIGDTIIINNFGGLSSLESLIFRNGNYSLEDNAFYEAGKYDPGTSLTLFFGEDVINIVMESAAFSSAYFDEIRSYSYPIVSYDSNNTKTFNVGDSTTNYGSGVEEKPALLAGGFGDRLGQKVNLLQTSTEPTECFVAGTIINTDQGNIAIEKVKTSNTIRGVPVCRVTKNLSKNNLVLIKKDAFGVNRPNKDTISTHWHGVYLNDSDKEFVRLIHLVDNKKVIEQYYKFEYVYNIELKDKHSYMQANNLKVETLIPGHD